MVDARIFVAFLGRSLYDSKVIEINLFKMSDKKASNGLLTVERAKPGIKIKIHCECCQKLHTFRFSLKSLGKNSSHHIYCPECSLELAFLGSEESAKKVIEMHKREVETLIKKMGLDGFFENPFVIYDLINYIHDLAENKKVQCQCGSHEINAVFKFDKIELICKKCNSTGYLKAGNYDDLEQIKKMETIIIDHKYEEDGFKMLTRP